MTADKKTTILVSWIGQIALIIILVLFISLFIGQTYDISDVSMEPTFEKEGNRVIVFLTPYLFNVTPSQDSIIIIDSRVDRKRTFMDRVIESPLINLFIRNRNEHMWVKRVVGLPGDSLEIRNGYLYRNGQMLREDYIKEEMILGLDPVNVPEDHVYVLGDNRNHSSDSRIVGPIPTRNIQGKVIMRFLPFGNITFY